MEMTFSEFAKMMYPFCGNGKSRSEFVIDLTRHIMQDPLNDEDNEKDKAGKYNPLEELSSDMLTRIFNGRKEIAKKSAMFICNKLDTKVFVSYLSELSDESKDGIKAAIINRHIESDSDDWETKCANCFSHILLNIANKGRIEKNIIKKDVANPEINCRESFYNSPEEIFNFFSHALVKYKIKYFIENVDPTTIVRTSIMEKCDEFLDCFNRKDWLPYKYNSINATKAIISHIDEFCYTLTEYTTYLSCNMRPVDQTREGLDDLVPKYRDENPGWAINFSQEAMKYRKKLVEIYQHIYHSVER